MSAVSTSRTVRIFISSTFRDFAGERDLLVRRIFPELRRRCRERQVDLVDVDLRWGITEAEAQQGKVLPICLAEIDRSRPYFIGLLGERYGWVPQGEQYDPALVQDQPWLAEHAGGRSITELEVLHGVLNNPAMSGHALFYFRCPAYAQGRGGDYSVESPEHREKLTGLKGRIRQSGFPVVEDYPNPEALAQRVQEDLWKLIDAAYPLAEVPDALALERRRHESYGESRLGLYLGGESNLAGLNSAIREGRRTVLITGDSGSGKSALLANWLEAFRKAQPQAHLFLHHLGATNDAGEPVKLVRRWIEELARVLGEEAKLPVDPDQLYGELPQWLAKASAHARQHSTRWVIVLDALDKLRQGRDLRWLPSFLPEGVQLIATCLNGEVLTSAWRRLPWERELEVRPLDERDRSAFVRDYLGKYRKTLTPGQERSVLAHSLTGNPLFLKTLLEELRVFGVHEALEQRLARYLTSATVDDLFERVLERIEQDTAVEHVRSSMEVLWASRAGLAQDELLAVTGLVPAQWAAVQLGLDEVVIESGGRLVFAHDYLRKAVEDRYLPTAAEQQAAHRKLGEYFAQQVPEDRVAEELPWQWQRAGDKERLTECLTHREMFQLLKERNELELLGYWLNLPGEDLEARYAAAWERWQGEAEEADLPGYGLAGFLYAAGRYGELTEKLLRLCLRRREEGLGREHPSTLDSVNSLALLLQAKGNLNESESLCRRALEARERLLGCAHPNTLIDVNSLAELLRTKGDLAEAEKLYRRALEGLEQTLGREHPMTLVSVNNLALLLENKGDLAGAETLHRRALEACSRIRGSEHPETLRSMDNLAALLRDKGDLAEAEPLCRRALEALVRVLGREHPATLVTVNNLARLLQANGDWAGAEALCRRTLEAREKLLGCEHRETLASVNNLAELLRAKGDWGGAEPLYGRALEVHERVSGFEHPDTLASVMNLAGLLHAKGDLGGAEPLYRRALDGLERLLGRGNPRTLVGVNNLATLLHSKGDLTGAEPLYRRALETREKLLGCEHPNTLTSVLNLALLLQDKGDWAAADPLYHRAMDAHERLMGSEHPNTLACVDKYASLLQDKSDLAGAEPLYRRALEARDRVLGAEHPDTLSNVNSLAELLYSKGDIAEAEPLLRRTLEWRARVLGCDHLLTITTVNYLANVLRSKGDLVEAEVMCRRGLEARERVLGHEHLDTLSSINNLGVLLSEIGDVVGAETQYRRLLESCNRVLGSEHPDTIESILNLAGLLFFQGDLTGAEPLYRRALQWQERELGGEHLGTLRSAISFAMLLAAKGDLAGAEPLAERAVRGALAAFGPGHEYTKAAQNTWTEIRRIRVERETGK